MVRSEKCERSKKAKNTILICFAQNLVWQVVFVTFKSFLASMFRFHISLQLFDIFIRIVKQKCQLQKSASFSLTSLLNVGSKFFLQNYLFGIRPVIFKFD